jgi:hypothetical protein
MSNRMPSAQRQQQKQYGQHINDYQVGIGDSTKSVVSPGKKQNYQPTSTTVYVSPNAATNGRLNTVNHSDANGNGNYKTFSSKARHEQEESLENVNLNGNGEYHGASKTDRYVGESRNNVRVVKNSNSFTLLANTTKPSTNVAREHVAINGYKEGKEANMRNEIADNDMNGEGEDEELAYGTGIVNKLRQKFLVTNNNTEKTGLAKRTQSCENIFKKTSTKEIIVPPAKEPSETPNFHVVHSADDLIMESRVENKNSVIITLQDTAPSQNVLSKPPAEEDSEFIPPNVVASTKVLFEKYSNVPSQARKPNLSTVKRTVNSRSNGISASETNLFNGQASEAVSAPKNAYAKANGNFSVTNSYSSLDRNAARKNRHEQTTAPAKGSTTSEKVGNGYSGVVSAHSVGDLTTVGRQERERRSSSADRNSLNLDFSLSKPSDSANGNSQVDTTVISANSIPRRNRPNPAAPGKLVVRPASNLMPAATNVESLKLTTHNDIKTGEFEPARKWLSKFDGLSSSNVDDVYDDDGVDGDGAETGADAASPGIVREGEGGMFRSSYSFEGAGVVFSKSALSRTKKTRTVSILAVCVLRAGV